MTIHLIACVAHVAGKLAIGLNNDLLCRLPEDMKHFKTLSSMSASTRKNVVVMGRKTWFSIPVDKRPLSDRINIVITNNKNLHKLSGCPLASKIPLIPYNLDKNEEKVLFMTFSDFVKIYNKCKPDTFVIGGAEIYQLFLNSKRLKPEIIHLTELLNYKSNNENHKDMIFMPPFFDDYTLEHASHKCFNYKKDIFYCFLKYRKHPNKEPPESSERKYLGLCKHLLEHGESRSDRTNVGTLSSFGHQLHFDISDTVPLLTTKRVPWKHVIEELLWFCRGDTDAKILQKSGVKIWDGNTSREFLDAQGLSHHDEGVLGPGYGWQMRFFGAKYSQAFADTSRVDKSKVGGFDQLEYIVHELKNNPFSRRIMMCYWNPPDFSKTALLPCHFSCQFYVRMLNDKMYLDCHFTMRSNDLFLGHPFNIFSYTVLTYIIAVKCGMSPGKLIFSGGDVHIYKNHIQQVQEQLSRRPRPSPKLLINKDVKFKSWDEISISDFDVVGYFPHPPIKATMAV